MFHSYPNDSAYIKYNAVWTGSCNLSSNANKSFENAVYIKDEKIVNALHKEFRQIFVFSEEADWEHEWSQPEFRIGT